MAQRAGIWVLAAFLTVSMACAAAVAVFGEKAFHLLDFASGRPLGSHPWVTEYDVNAADPAVSGTTIFITSGDLVCLDLKK